MVLKFFLLLLLFSFNILAQDKVHCEQDNLDGEHNHFATQYLNWWAASKHQIKNAHCANQGNVAESEMLNYLNRTDNAKISESFHGINIVDEDPHLVDLLKRLTTYEKKWSTISDQEIREKQTIYKLPSNCQKVKCAVQKIFGKTAGVKLLYALDKYELNLSHFTEENLAFWKTGEIDTILEAVDDLPNHLVPFEKNKELKHYKRGYGPGEGVVANAVITVFSVWDTLPSNEEKRSTLVHEIGHNIGNRLAQDESKSWLDLSGWVDKDGTWIATNNNSIISKYGQTNPAEDFAETFVAYRYNPTELKKLNPKKYQYMKKNVFLGLEYSSSKLCNSSKNLYNQLLGQAKTEVNASYPVARKYNHCKEEMRQIILKQKDVSLKRCLSLNKMQNKMNELTANLPKQERDIILNSIKYEDPMEEIISEEEELQAFKNIISDFYGSIAVSFKNYDGEGCDLAKKYGSQDLYKFNQYHFGDQYRDILSNDKMNNFVYSLCKHFKGPKKLECSDLELMMFSHIPKTKYFSKEVRQSFLVEERKEAFVEKDNTRVKMPYPKEMLSLKKDFEASKQSSMKIDYPDFSCKLKPSH